MGFDQYHEPPDELPAEVRTFARICTSLIEEAEAIGWYEQRLSLEKDRQAKAIMKNAQHEEMKHFGMDLEFLLRKKPQFREVLEGILFTTGNIVKLGDEAEDHVRDVLPSVVDRKDGGVHALVRPRVLQVGRLREHPLNSRQVASLDRLEEFVRGRHASPPAR